MEMPKQKQSREKQGYQIESVTYVKVPDGVYPEDYPDARLRGKTKYTKSDTHTTDYLNTTWGKVKKDAYNESLKDKNVRVTWKKNTHIEKVVRKLPNGIQEITYYNPVKK